MTEEKKVVTKELLDSQLADYRKSEDLILDVVRLLFPKSLLIVRRVFHGKRKPQDAESRILET